LEDYGSFYVSGLAVVEKIRGLGLGTELMAKAETLLIPSFIRAVHRHR